MPTGVRAQQAFIRVIMGRSFDGSAELVRLVEDVLLTPDLPRDDRAEFELARLKAIRKTAQLIPFYRSRWSPRVASSVEAYDSEIQYNEPGGEWILRSDIIWER